MTTRERIEALARALGHDTAEIEIVPVGPVFDARLVRREFVTRENFGRDEGAALEALLWSLEFIAARVVKSRTNEVGRLREEADEMERNARKVTAVIDAQTWPKGATT